MLQICIPKDNMVDSEMIYCAALIHGYGSIMLLRCYVTLTLSHAQILNYGDFSQKILNTADAQC